MFYIHVRIYSRDGRVTSSITASADSAENAEKTARALVRKYWKLGYDDVRYVITENII